MLHPTQASMELLLSPRAAVPRLPWQHRCVVHCLLTRKQPRLALRYLHWTRPAIESADDAKLCADVLLQNRYILVRLWLPSDPFDYLQFGCLSERGMLTVSLVSSLVSDAWALLKRGHTGSEDMLVYFLQTCNRFGLCTEALKYIPAGCNVGESLVISQNM